MADGEVGCDLTNLLGRVKPASMKKISLVVAMLYAVFALAYAGPERYSDKEIKEVVPPPPSPRWTGFYVGAFGGYKFGSTPMDLSLGGDWNFRPQDRNLVEAHAPDNLDASGAEAGGLIGYNYQFTNNWVVGLEAAGGYLWLRNSDEKRDFSHPGGRGLQYQDIFQNTLSGYDWTADRLLLWQVAALCDRWTRHW